MLGLRMLAHQSHVADHHFLDKLIETHAMLPTKLRPCFGGISNKRIHLGWSKIAAINFNQNLVRLAIKTNLALALATPANFTTDDGKSPLDEFAHRMAFSGGQNIIVGFVLLDN